MKVWVLGGLAAVLLTGCSTTSMKGTPFYTGEYEKREGPAADRVNLWPVLYYRDPALSVLWPIMEASPSHLAVRPIYSVYDRDTDQPVYNVLWPISRFDTRRQNYRIFPVYWGPEHFNVFPLYWHNGDPFSGTGYNALFPLWIWNRKQDGSSLDLFWPLYARRDFPDDQSWRLWPLYGTGRTDDTFYRFAAWPFYYAQTNSAGAEQMLLPLYWTKKDDERNTFVSLPYSRSRGLKPGALSWELGLPLGYRSWEGNSKHWECYPLLSWGNADPDESRAWYALGLGMRKETDTHASHYVLPLYYYSRDPESRVIYTLPWWNRKNADGSGGHALFPVYYRNRDEEGTSFYSLPWWSRSYADGSGWRTVFPLFYHGYADNASTFYSPLWFSERHADGSAWQASFPFYFRSRSADGTLTLTPLYARKQHSDGSTAWHAFIPLVYLNEDYDSHFLTVLGGRWKMGDLQQWLALPLLSWGAKDAESGRNLWLAGLAGQRWDQDEKSHYIFPFYYAAPYAGAFVSLPYTTWASGERKTRIIPPLLSGRYTDGEQSGALMLAGLGGYRSGSPRDYNYLIPFYYAGPDSGTFLSLPYAQWRDGERRNRFVPPLLSWWYSEGDAKGAYAALGLAGFRSGDELAHHYIFPLYYSAPQKDSFVSLPYAAWKSGETTHRFVPLLLSGQSRTDQASDTLLLGGLAHWATAEGEVTGSHLLPFYAWSENHYFYTALFGKNDRMTYYATPLAGSYGGKEGGSGSWIAPLYWHRKKAGGEVKGNYLLLGYYRKNDDRLRYGAYGLFDHSEWSRWRQTDQGRRLTYQGKVTNWLLFLAGANEYWNYSTEGESEESRLVSHTKKQNVFLLWNRDVRERIAKNESLETASLLGFLWDKRHERKSGEEPHDYLRRRILWRLYHYEKLNGDVSVDVFPGVTVDSYANGYRKTSFLWRLFRYENDPESGRKKLDLLFIPLKR